MRLPPILLPLAASLALIAGTAACRSAADTQTLPAVQCVFVRADGPQRGNNGERYLDVEGKDTGKYACFGVLRFDAAALKRDMDAKYGAQKYRVSGVTLELTQSNTGFTKDGSVAIYLGPERAVDTAALKYPYDPNSESLAGTLISAVKFARAPEKPAAAGDGAASPGEPGKAAPPAAEKSARDAYDVMKDATGKTIADALTRGGVVTLVLAEGDPKVAATWAGLRPTGDRKPPTLLVKVIEK